MAFSLAARAARTVPAVAQRSQCFSCAQVVGCDLPLAAGAEAEVKKATAALDRKNTKLKDDERRESVAVDHMKVRLMWSMGRLAPLSVFELLLPSIPGGQSREGA